jgi:YVTN family beta-propeller protein
VSVINSTNSTLLKNIVVGSEPVALLFNPSNNNIYVANVVSNSISIVDTKNNVLADTINLGSVPIALEFNPSNNNTYVASTLTGADGLVSAIR